MINTRIVLPAAAFIVSVLGCASVAANPGVGQAASIDHVTLSADRASIEVVVLGAASLSQGGRCGADFELASSAFNGTVLQVLVRQTAERTGDCAQMELVCCEHTFNIPLPAGQWVDRVRDLSDANHVRELSIAPPGDLYELHDLPPGWELRREWAVAGGAWIRQYSPDANPAPWSRDTLLFRTSFGGGIYTEADRVQPPVLVNGVEAQYMRFPEADNLINLQWLVGGQALALQAYEPAMSIDQLVALAEGMTPP